MSREVAVCRLPLPARPPDRGTTNGVEMLMPCFTEVYADLGINQRDIDLVLGSSDYLAGRAFSFISAIDSIGAVPPINECARRDGRRVGTV